MPTMDELRDGAKRPGEEKAPDDRRGLTILQEAEEVVRLARSSADALCFLYEQRSLNVYEIQKIDAARESIATLKYLISRLAVALPVAFASGVCIGRQHWDGYYGRDEEVFADHWPDILKELSNSPPATEQRA